MGKYFRISRGLVQVSVDDLQHYCAQTPPLEKANVPSFQCVLCIICSPVTVTVFCFSTKILIKTFHYLLVHINCTK